MPLLVLAFAVAFTAAFGCSEEVEPEQPVDEPLPARPTPSYSEGNLSVAQRGVAIDEHDLAVIGTGSVGVSPDELTGSFGLLVLNRPYVDWRTTRCPRSSEAAEYLPRARSEAIINALADERDVHFDKIAVNVALLTPGQRALLYVCFDEGARVARFDVEEHRRSIIAAFQDLAGLPGIAYITVGVEMNRYYHLVTEDGEPLLDDYTNWVTLYRDVYRAIKEVNPDVKVGPGISWAVFRRRTMPAIAEELRLEDRDGVEAAVAAARRTILPLLAAGRGAAREKTADYLGVTMIPFDVEAPFEGEAASDDPDRLADLLDYWVYLPYLLGEGDARLPLVLPIVDWAEASGAGGAKKGPFLTTLKRAVSDFGVAWAAWRRLSDLPRRPEGQNPCNTFTANQDPALRYEASYCRSGMMEESGVRRDVFEVLTED
ncbi:MAG: hypothetical protein KC620_07660 [Myxococcales bacterium]|nr:hypothetical protein [Myxococcales bacterium]